MRLKRWTAAMLPRFSRRFTATLAPQIPRAFLSVLAVAWSLAPLRAAEVTEGASPDAPVNPWQVYLFLEKHCAECHGGHVTKPKADLGFILDLRRLKSEAYVLAGRPDESDLYTALITDDADTKMPPPDSDGPKPTAEQIAMVHAWIAAGAPLDDPAATATTDSETASADAGAATDSGTQSRSLGKLAGRLHPLLVHFPIALLLCALAAELGLRWKPTLSWLHGTVRGSLWIGAPGAILSAGTGWLIAKHEGFTASADLHRWLGIATAAVALLALVVCEILARRTATTTGRGYSLPALLLVAGVLTCLAGHTGGVLVWGKDYFPF